MPHISSTSGHSGRHFPTQYLLATWMTLIGLSLFEFAKPIHAVNPVFDVAPHALRAEVNVLAVSTLVHDSYGNQDVYLGFVQIKGMPPTLARLIDDYPAYDKPIRPDILRDRVVLTMKLIRLPEQDAPARNFFLPEASSNIFDPDTRAKLKEKDGDFIPCFSVVHPQTRLAHTSNR